jgi:hypothetical protein
MVVYDKKPAQPKPAPNTPPRPGETQLDATRRVLRESGMNAEALDAINAANAAIDRQTRRK